MSVVENLRYRVPEPNSFQRAMWEVSSSRLGAWLFARLLHRVDRLLLHVSGGRITSAARLLAGVPVITLVTMGARSGQRRETPLLAVPVGGDLAVIGTRFGQPGTPGWYYNLRHDPSAQVVYGHRTVNVVAREAEYEEWTVIWERARQIYAGYEAYSKRITARPIHIMVLSAN